MTRSAALVLVAAGALAGCPKTADKKPAEPPVRRDAGAALLVAADAGAEITLPPAPPLPGVPAGLPAPPAIDGVSPEAVMLGELLFHDPRLSSTGAVACATCHVPTAGFAGAAPQRTAAGKPNLRRAPSLVNLGWVRELGWDGRYPSLADHLPAHARGQLGDDLAVSVARLDALPVYHAHFARTGGASAATASTALGAYVMTRYSGDATWDRLEREPTVPAALKLGYQVFTGKAQCSTCHVPPLYTDLGYHRLGLLTPPDEGRGRTDARAQGAFRTPSLRGAAQRTGFFHAGQAGSLAAAIDWHLAGGTGQGADPSIVDLRPVVLTPDERTALHAFVAALSPAAPPAPAAPTLP